MWSTLHFTEVCRELFDTNINTTTKQCNSNHLSIISKVKWLPCDYDQRSTRCLKKINIFYKYCYSQLSYQNCSVILLSWQLPNIKHDWANLLSCRKVVFRCRSCHVRSKKSWLAVMFSFIYYFFKTARPREEDIAEEKSKKSQTHFDPRWIKRQQFKVLDTPERNSISVPLRKK